MDFISPKRPELLKWYFMIFMLAGVNQSINFMARRSRNTSLLAITPAVILPVYGGGGGGYDPGGGAVYPGAVYPGVGYPGAGGYPGGALYTGGAV